VGADCCLAGLFASAGVGVPACRAELIGQSVVVLLPELGITEHQSVEGGVTYVFHQRRRQWNNRGQMNINA